MGLFGRSRRKVKNSSEYFPLESYELCDTSKVSTLATLSRYQPNRELPDGCYELIFSFLCGSDLKCCRVVCRLWKTYADDIMAYKTQILLDGRGPTILLLLQFRKIRFSARCTSYLKNSETRFSLWSCMKMHKIRTNQIFKMIVEHPTLFQDAVAHISTLELRQCSLTWMSLTNILKCFTSLQRFILLQNKYYYHSLTMEDIFYIYGRSDLVTAIFGVFWPKFPKDETRAGKTLRYLEIEELPNEDLGDGIVIPRRGSSQIMTILGKLKATCDEIKLKVELQSGTTRNEEINTLWLKLIKFYNNCQIKVLHLDVSEFSDVACIENFIFLSTSFLPLFSRNPLEELYLSFPLVPIDRLVEEDFLEFIAALKNLRVFHMHNIDFKGANANTIMQTLQPTQNNCQFRFGIILSDEEGLETAQGAVTALTSHFIQTSLIHIKLHISDMTEMHELKAMLPAVYDQNGNLDEGHKYLQVLGFQVIFSSGDVQPAFLSFNIDILTLIFPNLTVLSLSCGPYTERDYYCFLRSKTKQNAIIDDYDLRLVLQHLVKLRKLSLWANLERVSDFGMTGKLFKSSNVCSDVGYSFSSLKDLEKLSLRGVGRLVTDNSAYHAFNSLPILRHLEILGKHKITSAGIKFLQTKVKTGICQLKLPLLSTCGYFQNT